MCDYSLQHVRSRSAAVGDKLVTTNFSAGTRGFSDAQDCGMAVCVKPGSELAFDGPIQVYGAPSPSNFDTAIFRQINVNQPLTHHDALEFPDGKMVLLTFLVEGQGAHVLQLPAEPKTEAEAKEQERVPVVA